MKLMLRRIDWGQEPDPDQLSKMEPALQARWQVGGGVGCVWCRPGGRWVVDCGLCGLCGLCVVQARWQVGGGWLCSAQQPRHQLLLVHVYIWIINPQVCTLPARLPACPPACLPACPPATNPYTCALPSCLSEHS
jgi:hypothetical protein